MTIHPDNAAVWDLFEACSTQWLWVSRGLSGSVRSGLNYPAVESTMRMMATPVADVPKVFEKLRLVERVALSAWAEKRADA